MPQTNDFQPRTITYLLLLPTMYVKAGLRSLALGAPCRGPSLPSPPLPRPSVRPSVVSFPRRAPLATAYPPPPFPMPPLPQLDPSAQSSPVALYAASTAVQHTVATYLYRWMLRMTAPPWGVPVSCRPDYGYPSAITALLDHELSPSHQALC
ncbi:hypothetical protein LX32DRAFT_66775 [Colletotrichum zoysiae]|uniref:Uncharacterized protein n=1 Tax=Colletotrichum zoysiae TaxID=1216348 RepID=A0AAD9HBB5_9PEZI|nr:hypothetical protein LX32DRAFT_66775 [Colletotrichum zoysiae]